MNLKSIARVLIGAAAILAGGSTYAAPPDIQVVEYFHRSSNHYFMTGSSDDQRLLDAAAASGQFARTGRSFSAWSTAAVGRPADAVPVARFFSPALASHVFTANAADIAALRSVPATANGAGFVDEGIAFFAMQPESKRCATGLKAIYRAYNNRPDGNHRYSNDVSVQAAMVSTGFLNEDVAFCSHFTSEDAAVEKAAGTPRSVGEDRHLTGAVSGFVSISDFMIGSQHVNASNARFDHGAPSALANGMTVSVEGVIVNGILVATEVSLPASTPLSGDEIKGFITAIGSNGSLFVNGTAVDVSRAVVTGGTLAQLVVGTELELHGAFLNAVFVATLVHIEDSSSSTPNPVVMGDVEMTGTVSSFVSITSFSVGGQTVNAQNAVFEDGTAANLANGAVVEVHGRVVSGVLVASRVEFKSVVGTGTPPVAIDAEVTGAISGYVSVSNFLVAGQRVNAQNAVFSDGTAANLANGAVVEVHGSMVSGVLVATRVEFKSSVNPPSAGVEFESTGAISGFVSVSSFVIAGTRIDASAASFERGTAANLANGVIVEVRGTLANGVVKADRVRFER